MTWNALNCLSESEEFVLITFTAWDRSLLGLRHFIVSTCSLSDENSLNSWVTMCARDCFYGNPRESVIIAAF